MTPVKAKELFTEINKKTGLMESYSIITGELIYKEGQLVKDHDYAYTVPQAQLIGNMIREGKSLREIGDDPTMPSLHLIYAWRRAHPDFKQLIMDAKADRAEYMRDKAQEVLEKSTEDTIKVDKLQFDGYLKLAEKDDPIGFGKPTEQSAGGVQIIVNTGIVRDQPDIIVTANKKEEIDDE